MRKNPFTLDDFMRQFDEVLKLGPISRIMRMIPSMKEMIENKQINGVEFDSQMDRMMGIYNSMTKDERHDSCILDHHRCHRIARGAGVELSDVEMFMKQFEMSSEMMSSLNR